MTPEQIRAAVAELNQLNDVFYNGLAKLLTNWGTIQSGAARVTTGTTQDVTAVAQACAAGDAGIHMLVDASIGLGQALNNYAARL